MPRKRKTTPAPPKRRVLVLDADRDRLRAVGDALAELPGVELRLVTDVGAVGMALVQLRYAVDLALVDVALPGELDAYAVAEALQLDGIAVALVCTRIDRALRQRAARRVELLPRADVVATVARVLGLRYVSAASAAL